MVAIRGHFDGEVFVPDEPVDVPQGRALILHVEIVAGEQGPSDSGSLGWIAQNAVDDPALPEDAALQHDHYLYDTPKLP